MLLTVISPSVQSYPRGFGFAIDLFQFGKHKDDTSFLKITKKKV